MSNPNDAHANLMRKRVSRNPYSNMLTSLLLEMSHPIRIDIGYLEGVQTNINYFDMDDNDKKENYLALTFKSEKVERDKSLEAMKNLIE
jgi:hypothetical protein